MRRIAKAAWIESQNAAWEKQQKKIEHTKDLISIEFCCFTFSGSWRNFRKRILLKGRSRGNRSGSGFLNGEEVGDLLHLEIRCCLAEQISQLKEERNWPLLAQMDVARVLC